jgi:2-keto-3-deoxy-6-phosphogluconate aldolase
MPALPAFQSRVVPVIALTDVAHAVPLAEALLAGGIDVMEITLRTPQGLACIEAVARNVPAMHLGAGTVTQAVDVAAGGQRRGALCPVARLHACTGGHGARSQTAFCARRDDPQ